MKYQIAMIEICNASEKCKVQQQIENLRGHTEGFQALFAKEQQIHLERLKAKEAENDDLKKKELENYEQQLHKFIAVEEECKTIESKCNVLKKRNKAIMLNLRRKLLETDEIRRKLTKNKHMEG
ncbi:unnamed protein product [Parnassius apollo]|uniref:(apollo) hypothetical protein n=1 Tax=Parnassius apollo TaxID=110799 RepID=A0A8S3Y119_PARAO|nr:unnamed protein product [Parnassius apollo]